jgi:hypothetical protein
MKLKSIRLEIRGRSLSIMRVTRFNEIPGPRRKKVIMILSSLLLTLFLASFASLPDIKEVSKDNEIAHKTPQIKGSHGDIPPQTSEAIINKLEKQAGGVQPNSSGAVEETVGQGAPA